MATFEIKMPKLGESITEGTIISWSVKVGDTVEEDDVLFEVSTAKVSAEIPSPVEGKVKQLLFNEGDTVAVGTVVAILEIEGEGEDNGAQPETSEATQPKEQVTAPASEELSKNSQEEDRWYSPVVLQLAKTAGVSQDELDHIPGTGYLGRLSKKDIQTETGSCFFHAANGYEHANNYGSAADRSFHAYDSGHSIRSTRPRRRGERNGSCT